MFWPMEEAHTLNTLVRFAYRDLAAQEVSVLTRLLLRKPDLKAVYAELLSAKAQLPKAMFNPSTSVLNRILQYSAKTATSAC